MEFTIRLAEPRDNKALTVLFNSDTKIFGDDATGFGDTDTLEYINDPKKMVFVCEHAHGLAGALVADYHTTYSHLETLIVAPDFQKTGVGTALFDFYEKDLERINIPLIEVMTGVENTVMQNILTKRGFRQGNTFVFYSKGK